MFGQLAINESMIAAKEAELAALRNERVAVEAEVERVRAGKPPRPAVFALPQAKVPVQFRRKRGIPWLWLGVGAGAVYLAARGKR